LAGKSLGRLGFGAGFIVSVVGFSIALVQIRRSRKAAEAAEQAVIETRGTLARNLTINDLARASQQLQQMKDLHLERQWRRALDRYYDIRVMLSNVRSQYPNLTERQESTLQMAIQHLETLESDVREAVRNQRDPDNLEIHDLVLLSLDYPDGQNERLVLIGLSPI
jgi:uncharacterized membrane protein YgaE (UPF0421/DUF939 family)